jgi:putative transposase
MPSHVHWIVRKSTGRLSDLLRDIKSFSAKELLKMIRNNPVESRKEWMLQQFRKYGLASPQNQEYQIWKHDNHPFWLESAWMIDQKENYIHKNPVKAGFVNEPHEWRLSSANPSSPIQVLEM